MSCTKAHDRCHGYTLLEMLLVLAIMVLLGAIVLPAVSQPLGKSELRDAAKQVRTQLARARLEAIESGRVYQFRFQPGRRKFEVAVKSSLGLDDESDHQRADDDQPLQGELPSGVCFHDQQAAKRPGDDETASGVDFEETGSAGWSEPILFYPNGRTTSARIWLAGERDYYLDVMLRGVTGSATVGQLVRPEQEP